MGRAFRCLRQFTLQPGIGKANKIIAFMVRFQDFKQPLSFHFILSIYFHSEGRPTRNIHTIPMMSHFFSFRDNLSSVRLTRLFYSTLPEKFFSARGKGRVVSHRNSMDIGFCQEIIFQKSTGGYVVTVLS